MLVLAAAVAGWSFGIEPDLLLTREVAVESADWPKGRRPLKIAFVADLHPGVAHVDLAKIAEVVRRINAAEPDLILLGGDYIAGRPPRIPIEETARALSGLKAPMGVVSVLGNHDWWFDGTRVARALADVGITVLENGAVPLDAPDGRLWVAGLADDSTRRPDGVAAFGGVPPGQPAIALMHDPASLSEAAGRAMLVLAGHTHGGQVRLPLVGSPVVPGRAPRRMAYGLMVEQGQLLYVTSGIGTSILPVRFNMPPEIVLLTLGPKS
ncbi:MAG TPA: metallophosphoesterase [Candidatus Omnitrophota bacterium]|nr:metallophosphoesterase [Candidatus Omnitrophota bacterium]